MSAPIPTRIFKSGNSLAVRIPKELAPDGLPQEAEIAWNNGVWTIRPIHKRKLTGLAAKFAAFSPGFMSQGRPPQDQAEKDWSSPAKPAQKKPSKA